MKQFGIFAKHWTPGRVKTRLAERIGMEPAAGFHYVCVETLVERFATTGDRRVVGFAPAERESEFQSLVGESWMTIPQVAGNLGKRMAAYFANAFDAGMERVILIGSDSPTMPLSLIDSAFEALDSHAVALGPTDDGGYYLIGMSKYQPEIFDEIEWGTSRVWPQTVDKLTALSIEWKELDSWYDVDRFDDLQRMKAELDAQSDPLFEKLKSVVDESCRE